MCTFINNQKETLHSRWLKIKELFFFWQAIDRKNLTEPMQKCQAVVIRIIKMLWKYRVLLIYDEEWYFSYFLLLLLLWKLASGKRLNFSPWISPSSSAMIFFLFYLLQLIESPPAALGKFIAWNCQSSLLSVNAQRKLGFGFNLHANQFSWPQHRI